MADEAPRLSLEQQALLLRIARESIAARLEAAPVRSLPTDDPVLNRPGAAFVTLRLHGELRGCIGFVQAVKPLAEAVAHCAVSAALDDPRFPPVSADEAAQLHVEISVLSRLVPVLDVADIRVGEDGVQISQAGRRGLLLPQVAVEFGWDREAFLRHTCRKAGLPPESWRAGAEIHRFTVTRFAEPDAPRH